MIEGCPCSVGGLAYYCDSTKYIFHSILAYIRLEKLRLAHGTNHFAMKTEVYLAAVKAVYSEMDRITGNEVDFEPE